MSENLTPIYESLTRLERKLDSTFEKLTTELNKVAKALNAKVKIESVLIVGDKVTLTSALQNVPINIFEKEDSYYGDVSGKFDGNPLGVLSVDLPEELVSSRSLMSVNRVAGDSVELIDVPELWSPDLNAYVKIVSILIPKQYLEKVEK